MTDAILQQFLTHQRLEINRSPLTVASYQADLGQFVDYLSVGGEPDLVSVTVSDVRAWLVERSQQGDGARTLRRKVQSLRALYKWMLRRGMVAINPAADVDLAKLPRQLPHLVREQSMDQLLDAPVDEDDFEQVRDHLMLLMLYTAGLRRAELIGLRDVAVDIGTGQMTVRGKRDKDRIVPFGPELSRWVQVYRDIRARDIGACEFFFVRHDGKPLYPSLVYRVVRRALQQVGGSARLSPHVLRHSFASAMLNGGADIASVKELLGHESLAATQIYTHVSLVELKNNYKHAHPRALKKGD